VAQTAGHQSCRAFAGRDRSLSRVWARNSRFFSPVQPIRSAPWLDLAAADRPPGSPVGHDQLGQSGRPQGDASEFSGAGLHQVCEFRAREAFRRREMPPVRLSPGLLLDEEKFWIEGAVLDHGVPNLAFAFGEKLRVNVWREGLNWLGLPVGPWLREAKRGGASGRARPQRGLRSRRSRHIAR